MIQSTATPRKTRYWQRHTDGQGAWTARPGQRPEPPPGAELAALRRGVGRDPGTVPEMWPYYTALDERGRRTSALTAEHAALTLFAVHQQSKSKPMHRAGIGLGSALRQLVAKGGVSAEAVDRRFAAAATATTVGELVLHLRGLITQLRGEEIPLDYDRLFRDLRDWQYPDSIGNVRRRWGADYFNAPSSNGSEQ